MLLNNLDCREMRCMRMPDVGDAVFFNANVLYKR